jgi:hypothetical protein
MTPDKGPQENIRCHLIPELQELRKEKLAAIYDEAARDSVFMREMHAMDAEWDLTSAHGLGAAD